jgi:hypothetical protein
MIVLQQKCPTIRNTEQLKIIGMLEEIQDDLSRYITPSVVNILCQRDLTDAWPISQQGRSNDPTR